MEQSPLPPQALITLPPVAAELDAPPPCRPVRRTWRRWLLAAMLAATVTLGLWLGLPLALGQAIEAVMAADTGAQVHVRVVEVTPGGLVMAPLVLGEDLFAERVVVRWRLADLLDRRLEQVSLSGVRARARFDAGGLSLGAVDRLIETQHMQVDRLSLPGATAVVTVPWGERRISFDAEKRLAVISANGDVTDLLRGQPLIGSDGAVRLALEARRMAAGGMAAEIVLSGGVVSGTASLQWARGRLRATLGEPLALSLAAVPPEIVAAAPAELRALLSGRLSVSLQPIGVGPNLQVAAGEQGQDITTALRAELTAAGNSRAAVELAGAARLGVAGQPERLDLQRLSLEVSDLPYGETRYDGALRLAELAGAPETGAARLRLMLLARRFAAAGVQADEAALAMTGRLIFEGGRLTYALSEPGSLYLKGARAPGVAARQPLQFAIAADGRLQLSEATGAWVVTPQLALSAARLHSDILGEVVVTEQLRGTLGGSLTAKRPAPAFSVTAESATLGSLDVTLKRLVGRLEQTVEGPRLTLSAEEATHGGQAALPLSLSAWAKPQDGRLSFAGTLADAQGRVEIEASGQHDAETGRGTAAVTLKPVSFRPGGLQPRVLFPGLAKSLQEASGSLAVNGTVGWDRDGLHPDLNVLLKDVETRVGGVALRKINSVIKLTGLNPATSPPGQMLAVGLIDAGLPLTDGQVTFHLKGGRLVIERGSTRMAGGHIAVGEFVYDPKATRPHRFSLEVSELDVGRLIELIDIDGLSATGKLSGNVPLSLRSDHVAIDDARLISVESGSVRYRPKEPPAFFDTDDSTRLVLKAFDNFEYDKMTMTLNGTLGGELAAGMHITGSNPGLYGGYPIEFNLNLSGKLDRIIDEALVGYQIPDQIKERMSWFGAR